MIKSLLALPFHVVTYRTTAGKLSAYSNWTSGTAVIDTTGQQLEFYNYGSSQGILELDNAAATDPLAQTYYNTFFGTAAAPGGVLAEELQRPLQGALGDAQAAALQAYLASIAADT